MCNPVVELSAFIEEGGRVRAGTLKPEEHFIHDEPYSKRVANEVEIFDAAYRNQLPVLLRSGLSLRRFYVKLVDQAAGIAIQRHDHAPVTSVHGEEVISV